MAMTLCVCVCVCVCARAHSPPIYWGFSKHSILSVMPRIGSHPQDLGRIISLGPISTRWPGESHLNTLSFSFLILETKIENCLTELL